MSPRDDPYREARIAEQSLLRKLLTEGYATLSRSGRGDDLILVDSSWLEITAAEKAVAEAIWKEAESAA